MSDKPFNRCEGLDPKFVEVHEQMRAWHKQQWDLVNAVNDQLLGCHVIAKPGGPTFCISRVYCTMGMLSVDGHRVNDTGRVGTRHFTIGAIILCHKIWRP